VDVGAAYADAVDLQEELVGLQFPGRRYVAKDDVIGLR
jgi:hypothetical protein